MKVAVVGSRNLIVDNLGEYLPEDCDEIISGGAVGIDSCAARYARANGLKLTEFLPEYDKYGRGAPLIRNKLIVDHADMVLAFWDGKSRGTLSVIKYCREIKKPHRIFLSK